jgi:tRNA(Ile)-lysidine synthetase-like protein
MEEIVSFWFKKDTERIWFEATQLDDQLIKEKFKHLLRFYQKDIPYDHLSKDEILAYILMYDQLVRHIFRGRQNHIDFYSKFALKLSLYCISWDYDKEYGPAERCFILMPLRHTFNKYYLNIVINRIKEYMLKEDSKYYDRFFKSTLYSYSNIVTADVQADEKTNECITDDDIFSILDPTSCHNLTKVNDLPKSNKLRQAFISTLRKVSSAKTVVISISGGVDSMVSSFILHYLSQNNTRFKVIGVHINYGNRNTCGAEVEFVKRWCKLLDIELYIRHITEIQRHKKTDGEIVSKNTNALYCREFYEKITKKIRFDMYKKFKSPIILGHNKDDCTENIFGNIRKSRSYDNLMGMKEFIQVDDCLIVRPMLPIWKKEIVEFADTFEIPHLEDSTPKWSDRGKMRDELFPFLNDFDPAIITGLLGLSESIVQVYRVFDKHVDNFYNYIDTNDNQITITLNEDADEKSFGYSFWGNIIRRLCQDHGISVPSSNAIKAFIRRIENNRYGLINLSKDFVIKYDEKNLIINL